VGTSKALVGKALHRLENEGFVLKRPTGGFAVKEVSEHEVEGSQPGMQRGSDHYGR